MAVWLPKSSPPANAAANEAETSLNPGSFKFCAVITPLALIFPLDDIASYNEEVCSETV